MLLSADFDRPYGKVKRLRLRASLEVPRCAFGLTFQVAGTNGPSPANEHPEVNDRPA